MHEVALVLLERLVPVYRGRGVLRERRQCALVLLGEPAVAALVYHLEEPKFAARERQRRAGYAACGKAVTFVQPPEKARVVAKVVYDKRPAFPGRPACNAFTRPER